MTEPRPQIARGSPPPSREGRRSGSPSEEDENCPPGHKRNMDNEYKDLDRVQHVPKKAKLGGDVTTVASTSTPTTTTAKLSQDSNVSVTAVQQQQQNTDCSSSSSSSSSSTSSDCPNGSWTPAPTPVMAMTSNGFRINSFNIHRLLIVCLMVAAKFTSDHFYSNGRYAKVGGLSLLELNQLELEFLFTIRFELNVKEEELQRVGNALLRFRDKEMTPAPQKGQARTMTEARAMPTSVPVSVSSATATIAESHRPAINTATGQHTEPVDTHLVEAQPQEQQRQQQQQQQHHHHHQPQPPQQQKPKTGRFSIPSPTSPKNGPMSDRSGPGTNSAPTAGTSQEHANVGTSASVTSIGMGHTVAATANAPTTDSSNDTVVVASGRGPSARPQLLSPPAERQRKKDDSEIQGSERSEGSSVEMDRSMDGSSSIVTQEL
ncbi:hypothetical protein BGZ83_010379 [Gryganskiella cystojenkinii]|nr:hypothetical protein BGZ83_010379 [Gryganskiella cystojenkinii]